MINRLIIGIPTQSKMLQYLRIPAYPYLLAFVFIFVLVGGIYYNQTYGTGAAEEMGGIYDQNSKTVATMPGPAIFPYDPAHPIKFPGTKNVPNGSQPIYNKTTKPAAAKQGTKPPDVVTVIPKPTSPATDLETQPPIIPNTVAPTKENEFNINDKTKDMSSGCPVVAPTGKLELAITAWTNNKRTGKHNSDSGSIDMGTEGGWYDYDNKGCCDYYFRKIDSHWMAIAPQVPFSEYTKLTPKGSQCDAFAGSVIAKGYHA